MAPGGYTVDNVQDSIKQRISFPAFSSVLDFEREKIIRFLI